MTRAYLSLGSNLGDSRAYLRRAVWLLAARTDCQVLACSSLYRTPPWGKTDQPDFFNAALMVETHLAPLSLLTVCQSLERTANRERLVHWGPRTLDVDIVAIEGVRRAEQPLLLPHPYYRERLFVLLPLLEILGDRALDPEDPTLARLADQCRASDPVGSREIENIAPPQEWLGLL